MTITGHALIARKTYADMPRKTKGLEMLRIVAGKSISRKKIAYFTPEEMEDILKQLDEVYPRTHRTQPFYVKKNKEQKVD